MKTKLDRKNINRISFCFLHKRSEKHYNFGTYNRSKVKKHASKIVDVPTENFNTSSTKRPLRADGLSLLPSALRPRLVGSSGSGNRSESKNENKSKSSGIFRYCHFRTLTFAAVVLNSLVFSFIIQNSYVSNTSAVSLALTVPSAPLSVNLNPNTDNGFAKSTDGNISVSTAANWGFQLSVQAKDSNALKNGSNSLTSITGPIDEATFKSGADYVNKWGFKPSKLNGAANTNFVAGPTTSPTIIEKTSASSASASQYTIAIGAKANSTLATGTYSNNFTFTATANTVSYNITYNLDSGTWSGKSPQTGSTIEKTIKLDENKPTKDGFEFLGWCNVEPTGNNTDNPTCDNSNNGTIYTAGQDYSLTNGSNTVTLNAIWRQIGPPPLLTSIVTVDPDVTQITFKVGSGIEMIMVGDPTKNSTNYWRPSYGFSGTDIVMPVTGGEKILVSVTPKANFKLGSWTKTTGNTQTWTANGVEGTYDKMKDVTHATCIAAGEEGMNVTDERNGVSYTIGKFADRCWMFSNLRLEPGTTLNTTTSDVSSSFTLPTQADSDAWTSSSQDYYSKKSMKVCKGTAGYTSSGAGNQCADQTAGVTEYYYNWYAAIANDAVGGTPTNSSSATTSLDSQSKGSICPKNWHLVVINNWSDVDDTIVKAWNADKAGNPGRLVSSGFFRSRTQSSVGSYGLWWSSSRNDDSLARRVRLANGSASSDSYYKSNGFSVRCELPKPKENITELQYLQDWGELSDDEKTQVKNSMQDEKNYTLTDKRDNTQYTVAKLKDGKIWMTQNLKIAGKNISSSDSDVSSSFEIPAATAASTFKTDFSNVNNSKAYVDSYGGLYTWYTATAGTGSSSITSRGVNATGSICPKGWRLPTIGSISSGDFADLVTAYGGNNSTGSAALRATPVPGFTYAGYVDHNGGLLDDQGSGGRYWSSTSRDSTEAYYLYLYSSYASPAGNTNRVHGLSARCVAR